MKTIVAALMFLMLVLPVQAGEGRERLQGFISTMQNFSARFEQVVLTERDEVMQVTEGRVYLRRPGQFRWDYETPFRQQIISDGDQLWSYDEDLAQVLVQPIDAALTQTPLMLLTDPQPLDDNFVITEEGMIDDLLWVALEPKGDDAEFLRVLIGLDERMIRRMVLYDPLGQQTRIRFTQTVLNGPMATTLFQFTPPDDVDLIQQ
ncbi:outer membrane lipoprotein carrier protein [Ectothiorhodosinus mongolicus]|uniref:Outer-membrane lipoprotein carrier protein n=1 Tax=Ectothiorhodosinus mongolicus TaxID=233100 RepID=A0A1R3VLZ6_9GAMM|nr:outer membrane lipoprotein chaperone LolA [Ectothiorhodosinus mongolicus]ULX58045.1 outer membrane lipoprotein carrier protein LolA [Ectothiorhodosinus mongolicus]SIT65608.1 outer membrane lipoprotein carrier protein [Ectothiorhodosinus mongolicus]